jgi:DNA polymerase-3 subunit epsilon
VRQEPDPELEALARLLEATGDYRVLRRFRPAPCVPLDDEAGTALGVILDFETTGFDASRDRIIQLALVPFRYSRDTGAILATAEPLVYFEDPGRPLPPEIVQLTGITDDDVRGRRIDDAAVEGLATGAALVIAHNASFDRPFAERRMPLFRDRHWACSLREVPWKSMGLRSAALEYLLLKHCGVFHAAHRADHDCLALLHLLATPFECGSTPFQLLLASARKKSCRVWAERAPYERRGLLKQRGYHWNPGRSTWFREVYEDELSAEQEWLTRELFGGQPGPRRIDMLDAKSRYSDRPA